MGVRHRARGWSWGLRGLGAVAVAAALLAGLRQAGIGPFEAAVPSDGSVPADGDGAAAGPDGAPPPLRAGRAAAGPPPPGEAHVEREGRVRLGARWRVHVVDAEAGRDVADATVEAEVDLVADPRTGGRHAVSAARSATTGPDGRVTLERMPSARGGAVIVRAAGYVRARVAVEASDAPTRDVEVRLVARLPFALASAPVDVVADGRPLAPGDATVVVTVDGGAPSEVRPGEPVLVDDDPGGAPTREATVRLLVPGYAGPPQRITLTRGSRARVDASLPSPREVRVVVLDPAGAPLPGVAVHLAPAGVLGAVEARTTWRGVTDAAGEVRATAAFASALAVRPQAAGRYFPVVDRIVDLEGPSTRVEAVGLALARLTLTLAGEASPAGLALAWSDVAFAPGVDAAATDDLVGGARATARGALRRTLPERVAVDDAGARPARVTLHLLPGTFTLVASAAGATSAPTSCTLPPEGAEVEVRLATLFTVPFTLVGDGPAAPSPFAAGVYLGHRAGVAERFAIERVLGRIWRAPPGPARDAWVAAAVAGGAGAASGLPIDVAAVGPTGRVEGRSDGVSDEGTLMLPDGRVALVRPAPRPRDGGATVSVGAHAFGTLVVRFVDGRGRPQRDLAVAVQPLEGGATVGRDLLANRTTDADGVLVVGVLPGDALALRPLAGAWLPTAADGAVAALDVAEGRLPAVAVRVGDGPRATVELRAASGR